MLGFVSLDKKAFSRRQMQGFTLIEAMVALSIGIVLIGGVSQIYSSSQQSSEFQDRLVSVQNNGRAAMDFFYKGVVNTGSPKSNYIYDGDRLPFGSNQNAPISTGIFSGMLDASANALQVFGGELQHTGSTLSVRFTNIPSNAPSIPSVTNCLGQAVIAAGQEVINTYVVSYTDRGTYELQCYVNGNVNTAQGLVEGVEFMKVLYGVDDNGDDSANYYSDWGGITNAARSNIVSLRVGFLVGSTQVRSKPDTSMPTTIWVLDQAVRPSEPFLRAYRVFTMTIPLTNLIP